MLILGEMLQRRCRRNRSQAVNRLPRARRGHLVRGRRPRPRCRSSTGESLYGLCAPRIDGIKDFCLVLAKSMSWPLGVESFLNEGGQAITERRRPYGRYQTTLCLIRASGALSSRLSHDSSHHVPSILSPSQLHLFDETTQINIKSKSNTPRLAEVKFHGGIVLLGT